MRRSIYILLILVLTLVACGLGSDEEPTPQPQFASVTPVPSVAPGSFDTGTITPTTQVIVPNSTNAVFVGATAVPSTNQLGPVLPPSNCTIPTGWQPYTVRAGDTLAVVAASIGSTADQLQSANCLTNPELIYVGQTLYLPNLPAIVPTTAPTVAGATNCPIPSGWQPYVVQAGDTLSLIAFSINSSVLSLQNANCLTNPDSLFVGQTIYLPSVPASAGSVVFNTAVPTSVTVPTAATFPTATIAPNSPPVFTELLRISPTQPRSDGASVTSQRTVSLNVGVVPTADTVRYFAGTSASDQNPVLVGIDSDPFNGTQINYTLSEFDNDLFLIAVAGNGAGFTSSNIVHLVYDATFNTELGAPVIQPFTALSGGTYTLTPNTSVSISWTQAPQDATRVEFYYQASGTTTTQLIGTDASPNNGALVSWLVPQSINGEVFARAIYSTRTVDSQRISVVSGQ
jgi:LysM repeat protein